MLAEGHTVRIVKARKSASVTEYYSSNVLRFFNRPNPSSIFFKKYKELDDLQVDRKSLGETVSNLNLLTGETSFQTSLQSSLISFFSDSGPFNRVNQKRIKKKFLKVAFDVFEQTSKAMNSETQVSHVYVPNGRYADQKAFIIAANLQNPNVILHFYEKGFTEEKYFLGRHSLHDRKKVQEVLKLQNFDKNKIDASDWFAQRQTNSARNEFIYSWEDKIDPRTNSNTSGKRVVLFNSSNDEFVSLGLDWNDSEWNSQWEAFDKISSYLTGKNYEIALRLHPNGINKSWREKRRERTELINFRKKFPDIEIYEPESNVSSYDLINSSWLVIVWNSTVGLEACHMGKPVVNLNASEWDEFIPILSIKSESEIDFFEDNLKKPSTNDCVNFISGRMALDKDLGYLTYSTEFSHKERIDFVYRLAKAFAGSRPFEFRYLVRALFAQTDSSIYRIMKRINFKTKIIGR